MRESYLIAVEPATTLMRAVSSLRVIQYESGRELFCASFLVVGNSGDKGRTVHRLSAAASYKKTPLIMSLLPPLHRCYRRLASMSIRMSNGGSKAEDFEHTWKFLQAGVSQIMETLEQGMSFVRCMELYT